MRTFSFLFVSVDSQVEARARSSGESSNCGIDATLSDCVPQQKSSVSPGNAMTTDPFFTPVIIGAIVGGVLLFLLTVTLGIFFVRRYRVRRHEELMLAQSEIARAHPLRTVSTPHLTSASSTPRMPARDASMSQPPARAAHWTPQLSRQASAPLPPAMPPRDHDVPSFT